MDLAESAGTPTENFISWHFRSCPGITYQWLGEDSTYCAEDPTHVMQGSSLLTVRDTNACEIIDTI